MSRVHAECWSGLPLGGRAAPLRPLMVGALVMLVEPPGVIVAMVSVVVVAVLVWPGY